MHENGKLLFCILKNNDIIFNLHYFILKFICFILFHIYIILLCNQKKKTGLKKFYYSSLTVSCQKQEKRIVLQLCTYNVLLFAQLQNSGFRA